MGVRGWTRNKGVVSVLKPPDRQDADTDVALASPAAAAAAATLPVFFFACAKAVDDDSSRALLSRADLAI